jgi:hypothetical protein
MTLFGTTIDPTNIEGSIDGLIETEARKVLPNATALEPELDAAVAGIVGIVRKSLAVYVLAWIEKKFPNAAAEVAALKAKIGM